MFFKKLIGNRVALFIVSVFAVFALLAVVFCSFFFFGAETFSVEIKDNVFNPKKIVIPKGSKVVWVNKDEEPHWPASDSHPTHTVYPSEAKGCLGSSLDACKGLAQGEEFEFVFDKEGVWGIHDHLFPGITMVVEVTEQDRFFGLFAVFKNQNKKVTEGNTNEDQAQRNEFLKLTYSEQLKKMEEQIKQDPSEAWEFLKNSAIENGQVMGNVHVFAHLIGNALYDENGIEGITSCDASFAHGCYHGVLEKMLLTKGKEKITEIEKECEEIGSPEKEDFFTGCFHGMGHGLLSSENLNVGKALSGCDKLKEAHRNYCYDGVFMENSESSPDIAFSEERPWMFCENLDSKYAYNCGRYQSQIFMRMKGKDLSGLAKLCLVSTDVDLYQPCLDSIGFFVAQNAQGDFEKIKIGCSELENDQAYNSCIESAAVETTFQKYQGYAKTSEKLCQILPKNLQLNCRLKYEHEN